jgi:hypothetical protein
MNFHLQLQLLSAIQLLPALYLLPAIPPARHRCAWVSPSFPFDCACGGRLVEEARQECGLVRGRASASRRRGELWVLAIKVNPIWIRYMLCRQATSGLASWAAGRLDLGSCHALQVDLVSRSRHRCRCHRGGFSVVPLRCLLSRRGAGDGSSSLQVE